MSRRRSCGSCGFTASTPAVAGFAGPMLGTCAGMIVLDRNHLGLVDIEVERNAYGRQTSSFEADLELDGDTEPLRGVFIRAPRVQDAGPDVEVLAELDGKPVLLREGRFIVASFHPELTGDTRVHELFLRLVEEARRCPGIASGTPSSTRRARRTRSAASCSRSSRGRSSSQPVKAGRILPTTSRSRTRSTRHARPRCRRTTSSARSPAGRATRPTARPSSTSPTRATALPVWRSTSTR